MILFILSLNQVISYVYYHRYHQNNCNKIANFVSQLRKYSCHQYKELPICNGSASLGNGKKRSLLLDCQLSVLQELTACIYASDNLHKCQTTTYRENYYYQKYSTRILLCIDSHKKCYCYPYIQEILQSMSGNFVRRHSRRKRRLLHRKNRVPPYFI